MSKMELLAPAGSFDALVAAVQSGANAVYIGGEFGSARAFAENFSLEEIDKAVQYAHLRDVKVYVTINTLFYNEEFDYLISFIDKLYDYQVDALIIQDIGCLDLVSHRYPDFDIHVSTQMTIHSLKGIAFFKKYPNVTRIILSRECALKEIEYIKAHTDLEIEVFGHGALCVSYSGQCLMSSMIGQRSGNRGECAQTCRLPYELIEDRKTITDKDYLLSLRDLSTYDYVDKLMNAGVDSLKIEGRMKRPEYVSCVINAYRHMIDGNYKNKDVYYKDMKSMFYRLYTDGMLMENLRSNIEFSGNNGILIGSILSYNKRLSRIRIKLHKSLFQGDKLRFEGIDVIRTIHKIYKDNQLVNHGDIGDIIEIDSKEELYTGNLYKVYSVQTIEKYQKFIRQDHKFQHISYIIEARLYEPLHLILKHKQKSYHFYGDMVDIAKNYPTSQKDIEKQFRKTGGTVFTVDDIEVMMDSNIFIPIKSLNALRRESLEFLEEKLSKRKIHFKKPEDYSLIQKEKTNHRYIIVVKTINQLKRALQYTDNVYIEYQDNIKSIVNAYKDVRPKFYLNTIHKDENIHKIYNHIKGYNDFIINDYGMYDLLKHKNIIIGTGMNVLNSYSVNVFDEPVILSYEYHKNDIQELLKYNREVIIPIYGKPQVMVMEHCPISDHYFHKKVKYCQKCKGHQYYLKDRKNVLFPLITDEFCRSHIYYPEAHLLKSHKNYPTSYYIHFTDEENVEEILDFIKQ